MFATFVQSLRLFRRDVWLYLALTALVGFTYFGIYALLLNLYLLRLGYGPAFIGVVNGTGPLAMAFASLPAGAITQRWGSRRALQIGFTLFPLGFALVPFAESIPVAIRPGWLVATYTLIWLGGTFFVVNTAPFLMAATDEAERNHAFAMQGAILPIAGFLGNLIGGLLPGWFADILNVSLTQPVPYRYPLWFAALFMVTGIGVVSATRPPKGKQLQTTVTDGDAAPYRLIIVLTLVMALRTGSEWVMRIFFNIYLDDQLQTPTALIGGLGAAGQLLGIVALIAPFVVIGVGMVRTIGWGMVGIAIMYLPLIFVYHWSGVGLGFMGMVALNSLVAPTFGVFCQESVSEQWRTTIASATTLAYGGSIAAIAFSGGFLVSLLGYQMLYLFGAALALAGALLFLLYFRVPRGELGHIPVQEKSLALVQ